MGVETESEVERDQFVRRITRGMGAGSESAYRDFYEAYFDRLYKHLLFATRGREDLSRELLQTVLLRVVRYIEPFEHETRFWAWLRQITRGCHIDHLRRVGRSPEAFSVELLEQTLPSEEPADGKTELAEALDRSLELEPDELQILQRAYFDKLPHVKSLNNFKLRVKRSSPGLAASASNSGNWSSKN